MTDFIDKCGEILLEVGYAYSVDTSTIEVVRSALCNANSHSTEVINPTGYYLHCRTQFDAIEQYLYTNYYDLWANISYDYAKNIEYKDRRDERIVRLSYSINWICDNE